MNKFAVFDIDGTLIRWQLYHALVDNLAKKGKISTKDYEALKTARMKWKVRENEDSFHFYEKELVQAFESSLKNININEFEVSVKEVVDTYSNQVYTFTRDLIEVLKIKKYTLIAISGSHQELVNQIGNKFNFNISIGTKYERNGSKFTGGKILGNINKKATLQKIIKSNNLSIKDSYGVGDSLSDASMLEIVDHPIAFNPDKKLFEIAKNNNWSIVIERKNVIYQLNNKDNLYVLE